MQEEDFVEEAQMELPSQSTYQTLEQFLVASLGQTDLHEEDEELALLDLEVIYRAGGRTVPSSISDDEDEEPPLQTEDTRSPLIADQVGDDSDEEDDKIGFYPSQ